MSWVNIHLSDDATKDDEATVLVKTLKSEKHTVEETKNSFQEIQAAPERLQRTPRAGDAPLNFQHLIQ